MLSRGCTYTRLFYTSSYLMNGSESSKDCHDREQPKMKRAPKLQPNQLISCASSFKPTNISTSIRRPINNGVDSHVHTGQSLSVRMTVSATATACAGTVVVSLICACASAAIARAICIILSFYIIAETDPAVISLAVRTSVGSALRCVEHAFAAGAGAGCCLQVLEALRHALLLNDVPFLASLRRQPGPDLPSHAHIVFRQVFQLKSIPVVCTSSFHQSLMSFSTSIGRFRGEVSLLNRSPVHPLCASCHKGLIILRIPRSARRAYRC